jgi:hypothetical protein
MVLNGKKWVSMLNFVLCRNKKEKFGVRIIT